MQFLSYILSNAETFFLLAIKYRFKDHGQILLIYYIILSSLGKVARKKKMARVEGNTKEEDKAKVVHNTKLVTSTEVVDSTMVKDDMTQHVFVFSEQSGVQL